MAKHLLTAAKVKAATATGRHSDGAGLSLVVTERGRRWSIRYQWEGRTVERGLGGADGPAGVDLKEARRRADEVRALVKAGKPPHLKGDEAEGAPRFLALAERYIVEKVAPEARSAKHVGQWRATLKTYAAPLDAKPLAEIVMVDVLAILQPIWSTKGETASRLRGRIERVLDAAIVDGLHPGPNPALWRGGLAVRLPKPRKLTRGHFRALPYAEVPTFYRRLMAPADPAISRLALAFLILTAARKDEVLSATWGEIEGDVWTLPAGRTKQGREHRVPLSPQALAILDKVRPLRRPDQGDWIFPSATKAGQKLSETILPDLGCDVTAHGFRSSFRDWAGDETDFPREIAEAALGHLVGSAVERAYRRSDALARRRELMDAWGAFVSPA